MSEFFINRLDTAHALIDEGQYDQAIELIQNLDTRIHDNELLIKLNQHKQETEKEYQTRYHSISMKSGDPYQSFIDVQGLKKWRSQEYLKFYDNMLREHDI